MAKKGKCRRKKAENGLTQDQAKTLAAMKRAKGSTLELCHNPPNAYLIFPRTRGRIQLGTIRYATACHIVDTGKLKLVSGKPSNGVWQHVDNSSAVWDWTRKERNGRFTAHMGHNKGTSLIGYYDTHAEAALVAADARINPEIGWDIINARKEAKRRRWEEKPIGVHYRKSQDRWRAYINRVFDGKSRRINLGQYATMQEAVAARAAWIAFTSGNVGATSPRSSGDNLQGVQTDDAKISIDDIAA